MKLTEEEIKALMSYSDKRAKFIFKSCRVKSLKEMILFSELVGKRMQKDKNFNDETLHYPCTIRGKKEEIEYYMKELGWSKRKVWDYMCALSSICFLLLG